MTVGSYTSSPPSATWRKNKHTPSVAAIPGDLLWLADTTNNYLSPAGQFGDQGTSTLTLRAFAARFAGIGNSTQGVSSTTAFQATVLTEQVVTDYPCESATFVEGDFVSASYSGGLLDDQKVAKTTDPTLAIGKVTKPYASATTTVEVFFFGRSVGALLSDAAFCAYFSAPPSISTALAGSTLQATGGDGCYSSASTASAGGPSTWKAGAGGATTSGTAGAAGATTIGGAAGGAATTGTPGAGETVTIQGGVGGAATAGTANGGKGGSVIVAAAVGGATTGGTAGVDGVVILRGLTVGRKVSAPAAMTTSATIAGSALLGGLITANQGGAAAATYTMPVGTVLGPLLPSDFATGDSFDFTIVNISTNASEIVTVAGDTAMTAVGNMTIAANNATTSQAWGTFRVRKTASNQFSFYRVG